MADGKFSLIFFMLFLFLGAAFATTPINSCQTLNTAGETYLLTADVSQAATCFTITAPGITLDCQGHTITGANQLLAFGVYSNQPGTTVKDCSLSGWDFAIYYLGVANGKTIGNLVDNCMEDAIKYANCDSGVASGNRVSPKMSGLEIYNSKNMVLSDNIISGGEHYGVDLQFSDNAIIINNTVSGTKKYCGFGLQHSNYATLLRNTANSNDGCGFGLNLGSQYNLLRENYAINNSVGNFLLEANSSNNIIINNTARLGRNYNIYIDSSSNNTVAYNLIQFSQESQIRIDKFTGNTANNNLFHHNNITGTRWISDNSFQVNRYDTGADNANDLGKEGNIYYFANGTPSWKVYDIQDGTPVNNWADAGTQRPFDDRLWEWNGGNRDWHPYVESASALTCDQSAPACNVACADSTKKCNSEIDACSCECPNIKRQARIHVGTDNITTGSHYYIKVDSVAGGVAKIRVMDDFYDVEAFGTDASAGKSYAFHDLVGTQIVNFKVVSINETGGWVYIIVYPSCYEGEIFNETTCACEAGQQKCEDSYLAVCAGNCTGLKSSCIAGAGNNCICACPDQIKIKLNVNGPSQYNYNGYVISVLKIDKFGWLQFGVTTDKRVNGGGITASLSVGKTEYYDWMGFHAGIKLLFVNQTTGDVELIINPKDCPDGQIYNDTTCSCQPTVIPSCGNAAFPACIGTCEDANKACYYDGDVTFTDSCNCFCPATVNYTNVKGRTISNSKYKLKLISDVGNMATYEIYDSSGNLIGTFKTNYMPSKVVKFRNPSNGEEIAFQITWSGSIGGVAEEGIALFDTNCPVGETYNETTCSCQPVAALTCDQAIYPACFGTCDIQKQSCYNLTSVGVCDCACTSPIFIANDSTSTIGGYNYKIGANSNQVINYEIRRATDNSVLYSASQPIVAKGDTLIVRDDDAKTINIRRIWTNPFSGDPKSGSDLEIVECNATRTYDWSTCACICNQTAKQVCLDAGKQWDDNTCSCLNSAEFNCTGKTTQDHNYVNGFDVCTNNCPPYKTCDAGSCTCQCDKTKKDACIYPNKWHDDTCTCEQILFCGQAGDANICKKNCPIDAFACKANISDPSGCSCACDLNPATCNAPHYPNYDVCACECPGVVKKIINVGESVSNNEYTFNLTSVDTSTYPPRARIDIYNKSGNWKWWYTLEAGTNIVVFGNFKILRISPDGKWIEIVIYGDTCPDKQNFNYGTCNCTCNDADRSDCINKNGKFNETDCSCKFLSADTCTGSYAQTNNANSGSTANIACTGECMSPLKSCVINPLLKISCDCECKNQNEKTICIRNGNTWDEKTCTCTVPPCGIRKADPYSKEFGKPYYSNDICGGSCQVQQQGCYIIGGLGNEESNGAQTYLDAECVCDCTKPIVIDEQTSFGGTLFLKAFSGGTAQVYPPEGGTKIISTGDEWEFGGVRYKLFKTFLENGKSSFVVSTGQPCPPKTQFNFSTCACQPIPVAPPSGGNPALATQCPITYGGLAVAGVSIVPTIYGGCATGFACNTNTGMCEQAQASAPQQNRQFKFWYEK